MAARYYVRAPVGAVHNAEQFSDQTDTIDLDASDWDATVDSAEPQRYRCPRAFVTRADGVLAYKALQDDAVQTIYCKAGTIYPVALKHIDQSACGATLQVTTALTLLY